MAQLGLTTPSVLPFPTAFGTLISAIQWRMTKHAEELRSASGEIDYPLRQRLIQP